MKVHVILQLEFLDGELNDATVLSTVFTEAKKALQEVQEHAIEKWSMHVDPNAERPEPFPGLVQNDAGEWSIKDTDPLADFTAWAIVERELA